MVRLFRRGGHLGVGRAPTSSFYSTLTKSPSEGASRRNPHRGADGNGTRSLVIVLQGKTRSPQGVGILSGPPPFLRFLVHPLYDSPWFLWVSSVFFGPGYCSANRPMMRVRSSWTRDKYCTACFRARLTRTTQRLFSHSSLRFRQAQLEAISEE
jgi:hypothetical protein